MAEYILDVMSQTSKLDWAFPFQRTGAFPIDRSAVFSSLEDAEKYALGLDNNKLPRDERGLGGTSYVGQVISVYEAGEGDAGEGDVAATVSAYIITPARGLMKLAATTASGDIAADVADLQGEVNTIISNIESIQTNIEKKANADNVYTKEEVYTKSEVETYVASEFGSAGHLKREIVTTLPPIAEAKTDVIYMVSRGGSLSQDIYNEYMFINGKFELIGNTHVDLSEYVTNADLSKYVTKEMAGFKEDEDEGEDPAERVVRFIKQSEIDKLSKLVFDDDDDISISTSISASNVKGLYTRIQNIVTGSTNEDFDSEVDGTQAGFGIQKGAQVNVIESIKVEGEANALDVDVDDGKTVTLPKSDENKLGLVKGVSADTTEENKVLVESDGTLTVNNVNINKLVQGEDNYLILDCGGAILENLN